MDSAASMRIDKWLWAVRLFKTRSLATEACRSGEIRLEGRRLKPSQTIRPGQILTVQKGGLTRTVKVTRLLEQRVGAKQVADFLEDLTPEEEFQKHRDPHRQPAFFRQRGTGRPTKRERRQLDRFRNE